MLSGEIYLKYSFARWYRALHYRIPAEAGKQGKKTRML
jgi:hypothetical protein